MTLNMDDFSIEKNLLKDDFEGKKILERKYQGKKYLSWLKILEKNLTPFYVGEKEKLYHHRFGEEKSLPKPNHPYPLQPP